MVVAYFVVERFGLGEFMGILLAVDRSECSDEAIDEVARRPWPEGSEVKVLTAFELPLPPTAEAWALPANYIEEMDRSASEHARSVVDRAVSKLRAAMGSQANIQGESIPGPARTVILDEADSWSANLIVVGSHGYRALERFLLGSVSQSVASHAKCSVEVVRCLARRAASGESRTSGETKE
jgi:nucleotide-binding universal stress UspA family protein